MRRMITTMTVVALAAGTLVACGGDDGGGASGADFCETAEAFKVQSDSGDAIFDADEAPSSDQLRDVFVGLRSATSDMVDAAPEEIADDAKLVGDAIDGFVGALEDADFDAEAIVTDPAFAETMDSLTGPEVTAAQDRITAFVKDECGVDLDA
jgi:hypothetical protein